MKKNKIKKSLIRYDAQKHCAIIQRHIDNGDYIIDAHLMTEMGVAHSTFSQWLHTYPEFNEVHDRLRSSKIASIVDRLVSGQMRPQCARLLLDCFDGIYPESIKRDLDRTDKELEGRLAGDLTDCSSELYISFDVKEGRDDEGE